MITLKQINYALSIQKNLHFKKAADECFVSPSTLSNAISEMEAQLGTQIFERDNKKVIVTKSGEEILKKAKEIKIQMQDIYKLGENRNSIGNLSISMGIIPTVGPYFLPLILPELKKKFPNLNLKIIEGQSSQLVSKVKDGDLDIAILALPFELKGLLALKFWKENFHLISHKDEVVKKGKKIKAKNIDTSDLLVLEDGHCLKKHIISACKISTKKEFSMESSSMGTLIQLVAGKMGKTLVPKLAVNQLIESIPSLVETELDEPGPHRELAVIIRPTYTGFQQVEELIEIFKEKLIKT
jgi:LysR family hydrogen peroxide-inducible transcriptional activator